MSAFATDKIDCMPEGADQVYLEFAFKDRCWNVELDPEAICRIGRGTANTVVLVDDLVSRYHAVIQHTDRDRYLLADLGSQNGTFVNNMRVGAPTILKDGDRIAVGGHVLVFRQQHAPEGTSTHATAVTHSLLQLRPISVLVMDIHDFTGMWAQEPAGISEAMVTFNKGVGRLLTEHRAWSHKYAGDSVMAVWLHEEKEKRLELQRSIIRSIVGIAELAGQLQRQFSLPFEIRMGAGVDCGLAMMGNIGSAANADYSALGEAVNRAFRIEAATRGLGCDVALGRDSFEEWRGILPGVKFREHRVLLKGFPEPTRVYACGFSDLRELSGAHA